MKPQALLSCLCVFLGAKMILETVMAASWAVWSSAWNFAMQPGAGQSMWIPLFSMVLATLPGVVGVILVWFAPWLGGFLLRFTELPENVEWSMAMDGTQLLRAILAALGIFFMATALPGMVLSVIRTMSATFSPWNTPTSGVIMNEAGGLGIVGGAIQFGAGYMLLKYGRRIARFVFKQY